MIQTNMLAAGVMGGLIALGALSVATGGKAALSIARAFIALDAALRLGLVVLRGAGKLFRRQFKAFYMVSHADLIKGGKPNAQMRAVSGEAEGRRDSAVPLVHAEGLR